MCSDVVLIKWSPISTFFVPPLYVGIDQVMPHSLKIGGQNFLHRVYQIFKKFSKKGNFFVASKKTEATS